MFFVTFHEKVANIYAYDDDGNLHSPKDPGVLDSRGQHLAELRTIDLKDGLLYIANGASSTSNVLCFQGSGRSYSYLSTLVASAKVNGPNSIIHPYSFSFDGAGHVFVSNQDSNVVAALDVGLTPGGPIASPAFDASSYLKGFSPTGGFLSATLVASSVGGLPDVVKEVKTPPPDISIADGGLDVAPKSGKVKNSVRGVLWYGNVLFVVDEPGGMVRVYDPATGTPILNSNVLSLPVQILMNGSTFYVGAGNQVFSCPVPATPITSSSALTFAVIPELSNLEGDVSGMAFDDKGNFHVAIRTTKNVYKYSPDFKNRQPWAANRLPDSPEFLLYIPD
jgi:hypothetical protein